MDPRLYLIQARGDRATKVTIQPLILFIVHRHFIVKNKNAFQ